MKQPKVFHLLHQAHTALFRASDRVLRESLDLSTVQQTVLFLLLRKNGLTISEIAESLKMKKSSLSGLIDRMADRGLIRRVTSEADRRSFQIELLPKGEAMGKGSVAITKGTNELLLEPFSTEEQEVIERFLNHISSKGPEILNGQLQTYLNKGLKEND